MAIDPSIIGNVMAPAAPQLPDVNAMMQTRTAGMENIYKIERQRAEDAKAAQAAEADETVKALIPAYAYALGNPSDLTGALDLAPPELRGALEPYVAQLQGKPPEQVQAALIGSLASSEVGRAFLEAQGRMQTAEIQRGQLTLAQQKAAREAEAEARGPQMTPYQQAQIELEQQKLEAGKAKETADETKKRLADEKRAKDLDLAISEVEAVMKPGGLIDKSTGSYLGNLIDTAFATVNIGTPGYQANAQLAPIADLVLKMVPRFEGPQSNYDVQSYKDAAGNLASPNVPNSVKKAAAKEIVRLFNKYRDQFEYAPDGGGAGAGAAEEAPGVIDFDTLGD
jgi:hypothetical protein